MNRPAIPVGLALFAGWALGAAFLPLGGMIHFLLIAALILLILDRLGRTG
ncbi:MAG: lmo0937 family membrane protein [Gemmatimonadota bacterium]